MHVRKGTANTHTMENSEVNQPDDEEEVVGDGKRLEQKDGDGGRLGIIADYQNREKVTDQTEQAEEAGSDRVNGKRQRCGAVALCLQ